MKKLIALILILTGTCFAGRGFSSSGSDLITINATGTALDISTGPMTISFWIYPTTIAHANIFGRYNTSGTEQYIFCIGDTVLSGSTSGCFLIGSYSAISGVYGGCGILTANKWYNFVVRVDNTGAIFGSPAVTFNIFGSGVNCSGSQAFRERRGASSASAKINCADQTHATVCFEGNMAELGVWNAVLSNGELASLQMGIPPRKVRRTALKAYYPLYGIASPEPDLSGSVNNGVLTGTTSAPHCPCSMP